LAADDRTEQETIKISKLHRHGQGCIAVDKEVRTLVEQLQQISKKAWDRSHPNKTFLL
jgi:hypothetical protein